MQKIFHLSSCSTCRRIIDELNGQTTCECQDIKQQNITAEELDAYAQKLGSYEALFSRKAMKFRQWGLHEKQLNEADYRQLILDEYTFLKRPVIIIGDAVFAGNTRASVAAAKAALTPH